VLGSTSGMERNKGCSHNDRALKFLNDFGFNRYAVKEKRMPSGEKI